MATDWMARAQAMRDELIERRRDFHRHPELAFEEVRTAGIVARELSDLGMEVTTGVGKTGVVAILEGQREGPTVMVRCDMDALPITEENTTDYISETPGKMHACGHDGHTAIALGVAKMLTEQRDSLAGRVKFVFQPAEETAQGANAMIAEGVLQNPAPSVILGLHLFNNLPFGEVGITDGPSYASSGDFRILIKGSGGHGALPEQARDPLVAGAQIVSALQTVVSRNISALDTGVLSVTMFNAGFARNVIPSEAELAGTTRAYLAKTHELMQRRLTEIATGVAKSLDCEAEVEARTSTPPLVNDPAVVAHVREAYSHITSATPIQYLSTVRMMWAEDMAFYMEKVPGTYLFVGSADASRHLDFPHHHPRFDFDEDALPLAAGLLATAVASYVVPA